MRSEEMLQGAGGFLDGEFGFSRGAGFGAKYLCGSRIRKEISDGFGERWRIFRRDQEAVDAGLDHLGDTSDGGGDDGDASEHGLHDDRGEVVAAAVFFGDAGKDEKLRGGEEATDFGLGARAE